MARVPQEELDRLKGQARLRPLLEAKGIELRRVGKDLVGRCPWHDGDREPSLHLTEGTPDLWHCFGCDAGGDIISWLQKAEGCSFRHAVEMLTRLAGRSLEPSGQSEPPAAALGNGQDLDEQKLLLRVAGFYSKNLLNKPEGLAYLEKRGLVHPELVNRFGLGYADRTLGYQLAGGGKTELRQSLKNLGVLREKTGHEHFSGCLVVPFFDEQGQVAQLYGRRIGLAQRESPSHLYLPRPHRVLWNIAALSACKEIVLCESVLDALSFWVAGHRNVVAAPGASGFCEEMLAPLLRHGIVRVFIAYDPDEAGERGAKGAAALLEERGVEALRVQFPTKTDANELLLQEGHKAPSVFAHLLRSARPLGALPSVSFVQSSAALPALGPDAASQQAQEVRAASSALPPLAAEAASAVLEERGDALEARLGDRLWRVRGFEKNTSLEQLRVKLLCSWAEEMHLDTLDLYSARSRAAFLKAASSELGVEEALLKRDLGRLLLGLEQLHEQRITELLRPKRKEVTLSEAQEQEALGLLRDPRLLERVLADFERSGLVGEKLNKLVAYLALCSRKLDQPLGILIQSSSAAGKSSLMKAVLLFMPSEEQVQYSAMTGQALYYMGDTGLAHKILAIAEEQGAQKASYALKLLLSEGKLSIASTGKDGQSGKLITHHYELEGPVVLILTTTAIEMDEELQNRCLVLCVDEGREQTRAIHELQRLSRSLDGLWAKEKRSELLELHQNSQRLLRPLAVVNPYAHRLSFLDDRTRTRRDQLKYLSLIDSIALVHQHQRPIRQAVHGQSHKEYIEVSIEDIELGTLLAHEVLGRTLDELSPQTRRFLTLLDAIAREQCQSQGIERMLWRFTQRQIREWSGWSDKQVKSHLHRLQDLEYVLGHRTGRGQSYLYELLYAGEGQDGRPFLMGLIDTGRLRQELGMAPYDGKWDHLFPQRDHLPSVWSLLNPAQVPRKSHPGPIDLGADEQGRETGSSGKSAKNAYRAPETMTPSYVVAGRNGGSHSASLP